MSRDIGVVMDPIVFCNYKKDTSLALLWAARDRGWRLWYMEQGDLYLDQGIARGKMRPLEVRENPADFYTLGDCEAKDLAEMDAILMRKDPPFDMEFVYTTHQNFDNINFQYLMVVVGNLHYQKEKRICPLSKRSISMQLLRSLLILHFHEVPQQPESTILDALN